jgi:hybrid cluster-associated redox disulfide protein
MAVEISKSMTFGELLQAYPAAARILASKGLHCIGCHIAVTESVEDGAKVHGLTDAEIDEMVDEIKAAAK